MKKWDASLEIKRREELPSQVNCLKQWHPLQLFLWARSLLMVVQWLHVKFNVTYSLLYSPKNERCQKETPFRGTVFRACIPNFHGILFGSSCGQHIRSKNFERMASAFKCILIIAAKRGSAESRQLMHFKRRTVNDFSWRPSIARCFQRFKYSIKDA